MRVENPSTGDQDLQRRFTACVHNKIKDMTDIADNAGRVVAKPQVSGQDACLSYMLKGGCWSACGRAVTHKKATPANIAKAHALMDACNVPAL